MKKSTIFPGRYVQGADAVESLGEEILRLGESAFAICSPTVYEKILPKFRENAEKSVRFRAERFNRECSDEEIERLLAPAKEFGAEVVVGIGGGKTLDTAKAVAHEIKAPVVMVPTIASTDAPCSALSVIYHQSGEVKRYLFFQKNPEIVLVDTKIVAEAPVRYLVSGMGDALATWFEAESCRQSFTKNMAGAAGSISAYALARLCYETLIEYGELAKQACVSGVATPALERVCEANTLLSGLGFESGGLAAAHSIHNGLTVLEEVHGFFHGEKVAIGTLAALFLTDKQRGVIDEVYAFCESVGLPTTLADIGMADATDEDLKRVAERSCAEGETIHNEPLPVAPRAVFDALKAADAFGRARRI